MSFPEFAIFPADSVAITLTTTVWVGVLVVTFFNLRFGWTLSGLVIPGYLVPLLLCKPISVGVIVLESIMTFCLVYMVSEWPQRRRWWCSFFGRDRFLALVIGSVAVRAMLEGWLFPWLGPHLNEWAGVEFDYRNDLHSYGLIIVSLMANYFWKPGFIRGGAGLATTIGITYLIVRYPLMELTNFNVGYLNYVYDEISVSLLSSPKAYILVLVAAWIASKLNLNYSWEFSGILIPSLLALLWCSPAKVAVSFIEAGGLLVAATFILRLPIFRKATIEGARRTCMFFTICFASRLLLSHLVPLVWPDARVTDFFGFGFLLSTLLAVKAYQKKIPLQMLSMSIQASSLGAVAGSVLGFVLTIAPMGWAHSWTNQDAGEPLANASVAEAENLDLLECVLRRQKIAFYDQLEPESYLSPLPNELGCFRSGVRYLRQFASNASSGFDTAWQNAAAQFDRANFDLRLVEGRYAFVFERAPQKGWGAFVFDTKNLDHSTGLVIEVPTPLDEPRTFEAGLCLFRELQGGVLSIGGTKRRTNVDGSSDMLVRSHSMLVAAREACSDFGALQIRSGATESLSTSGPSEPQLWVRNKLPRLDWKRLESLLGEIDVRWGAFHPVNRLREQPADGFAELRLPTSSRDLLATQLAVSDAEPDDARISRSNRSDVRRIEGPLYPWLIERRDQTARRHTDAFRSAQSAEMYYFDDEVVKPIVHLAANSDRLTPAALEKELSRIAAAASALDYRVTVLRDPNRNREYFALSEGGEGEIPKRHWGTYVFRRGLPTPFIVEIPRPLLERRSFEFGAATFMQVGGSALFVSGNHPHANVDGTSDLARLANKVNAFNLVHQSFLREAQDRPMLVIQSRAIRSPVNADVVMATDDGSSDSELSPMKQSIVDTLQSNGLVVKQVDGKEETAGYEISIMLTASGLNHSANKELVSLWVSPEMRGKYAATEDQVQLQAQSHLLDVPTISANLEDFLGRFDDAEENPIPDAVRASINRYLSNRDVVRLLATIRENPQLRWVRIDDVASGQSFLAILSARDRLPWVVNVSGAGDVIREATAVVDDLAAIRNYVESRAPWLRLVEAELEAEAEVAPDPEATQ